MRVVNTAYLLVCGTLSAVTPVKAEIHAAFNSNCSAWVSAIQEASQRPPLIIQVDETITGMRSLPDASTIRAIAKAAYLRNSDIRQDYSNIEDYVQFTLKRNLELPTEYVEHYQYRIAVTTSNFLVVSSNRMQRFNSTFFALAGTKAGSAYELITMDRVATNVVRSITRGRPDVFIDFLHFGCLTPFDLKMLNWGWRILASKNGESLWSRLCDNGTMPIECSTNGVSFKIDCGALDSIDVITIENRAGDETAAQILAIDKDDGRKLVAKETRSSEGVVSVRCSNFLGVDDSEVLYPLSIVQERVSPSGVKTMRRVLEVRSVEVSTPELINKAMSAILNGGLGSGLDKGATAASPE